MMDSDGGDINQGYWGQQSKQYIKLISSDGHEFIVDAEVMLASNTIKKMLSYPVARDAERTIRVRDVPSLILQKIICYLLYKHKYKNATADIPEFELEPTWVMELLLAANFLDC